MKALINDRWRVITRCAFCGEACDRNGKPLNVDPFEAGLLSEATLVYGTCCLEQTQIYDASSESTHASLLA